MVLPWTSPMGLSIPWRCSCTLIFTWVCRSLHGDMGDKDLWYKGALTHLVSLQRWKGFSLSNPDSFLAVLYSTVHDSMKLISFLLVWMRKIFQKWGRRITSRTSSGREATTTPPALPKTNFFKAELKHKLKWSSVYLEGAYSTTSFQTSQHSAAFGISDMLWG